MRLCLSILAVALWAASAVTFIVFPIIWFGGAGFWAWIILPMPFLLLLPIEAARRLRAPISN